MSAILSRLTVKPLLWACGLQLAALIALGGVLAVQNYRHEASYATLKAEAETTVASRDAWKTRAAELDAANFAHQSVNKTLRRLLSESQGENARLGEEGRAAVAAAEAAKDDADRVLAGWMQRYADQVRMPDCASALSAIEMACPMLKEGY